jgi:hypothetical protein
MLKYARALVGKPLDATWLELTPVKQHDAVRQLCEGAEKNGQFAKNTYAQSQSNIADVLCVFLLTVETHEMPRDCISQSVSSKN